QNARFRTAAGCSPPAFQAHSQAARPGAGCTSISDCGKAIYAGLGDPHASHSWHVDCESSEAGKVFGSRIAKVSDPASPACHYLALYKRLPFSFPFDFHPRLQSYNPATPSMTPPRLAQNPVVAF